MVGAPGLGEQSAVGIGGAVGSRFHNRIQHNHQRNGVSYDLSAKEARAYLGVRPHTAMDRPTLHVARGSGPQYDHQDSNVA